MNYYQVAVDAPLEPLTYKHPLHIPEGTSVVVPLGRRTVNGVVLSTTTEKPNTEFQLKDIIKTHPERPCLSPSYLQWANWVADYYIYPVGQVLQSFFPPLKKHGKATRKPPIIDAYEMTPRPTLSTEQSQVVKAIQVHNNFAAHLLWGVTGSGKTEVYLELLEDTIQQGKQGLVLVPEISLTPQLTRRFVQRFGETVAVIHSHLTDREKTNQWWSIVEGKKSILIGARSALFCPFPNLGLIILDEEHESSFKQDEKLKYNARDAAVVLAQKLKLPICLGSATPSLESWANAKSGKYNLHILKKRFSGAKLPEIKVISMKAEADKAKHSELPYWLSPELYQKLEQRLKLGEQSALFLNRRGIAKTIHCGQCGYVNMCPNCDISLTLHSKSHLICHYCDYHENLKEVCSSCGLGEPTPLGIGTEKVEQDIQALFPNARISRLDRDEIQNRETLTEVIRNIEHNKVDIIVGTQMIAKGLDFPNLTLVGVVLADISFNIPDFRTLERNFQLLTQVSGRPGRHKLSGEVIIQTYNLEHPSLTHAITHDYESFANEELEHRKELTYPPYGKMANIKLSGLKLTDVQNAAQKLRLRAEHLQQKYSAQYSNIQVLGPAPSVMAKLHNKFRYNLLLKSAHGPALRDFCRNLLLHQTAKNVKINLDIDPLNML